jgi:hypothetical protein
MGTKSAVGIARICAVAFGVLYVVAMLMIGMANDTSDKTPDQIMKDFDDNKSVALVGGYLLVIVGLLFLPLAWTAIQRVRPGLSAMTEQLAKWTALLFTAMVAVGGMVLASIAGAVIAGSEDNPPADIIRFIPQIGYGISLVAGALAVAVFLALVSRAGQVSKAVPAWFCWLGYVAAVAMLFGALFLPMVLLPIWAFAAALVLKDTATTT